MAEKANIIVNYNEEWFGENVISMALWMGVNMSKGCAMEKTFARFQTDEDAEKFKEEMSEI